MAPTGSRRLNPRSTTEAQATHFRKVSAELSLEAEARELERCRKMSIRTAHVGPPELIGYDPETNELTTRFIADGQSLYNALWNGTSLPRRMAGKGLDRQTMCSRMRELGDWLRQYHDSTDHGDAAEDVVRHLKDHLQQKADSVRRYGLVEEGVLRRIEVFCNAEFSRLLEPEYRVANHVRLCRVQGDFIASNIILGRDWNLYVSDFADTHVGASVEDIGRFCEQLLAMSLCGRFRYSVFSAAMGEFLEGYRFSRGFGENRLCKAFVFLNGLISAITEYTTRPYISRQFFTRHELKRLTRATLCWAAREVRSCGLGT